MSDVRDEVYEVFNNAGIIFVIACTTLLRAMGGTTYRYVRWVYVGIISTTMPSMPKVSLTSGGTAISMITAASQYFGNSTWVIDHFKPVNKTLAREQVQKEREENFFSDIADWFEKNWKGTGNAAYLVVKKVYTEVEKIVYGTGFFGLFFTLYEKIRGKRVPVVETAVDPPPKKTSRGKSPARKSTRTRK